MIWGYPNLPNAPYIYKRVESMIDPPEIGWFPMANDRLCGSAIILMPSRLPFT